MELVSNAMSVLVTIPSFNAYSNAWSQIILSNSPTHGLAIGTHKVFGQIPYHKVGWGTVLSVGIGSFWAAMIPVALRMSASVSKIRKRAHVEG
jgi:hypothetical protein